MASPYDKEVYHLTVSINKALNPMEAPLKIKHARSIIIATHRMKEVKSFWSIITRQALMENRFVAWKFCHLLHKVLREGHESALKQSQRHKKLILEMGKLWGHLQDGVGNCIQAYSKLLVIKLDFHDKNAIFPGSLLMDFREIEKAAGDDINVYFQLCVEIFDYLDGINDVQLRVFTAINTYRMSSMTPQGQCRLAPLITLIQDANPLYDLCVRIMFKLHDKLPNDILNGHRERFRELFVKVKNFYDNVRPLQYFSDLIQVPHLPETAPNFSSKVDFGSYVPPVMYVQPDPEPPMENLIDTSASQETPTHDMCDVAHSISKDKEIVMQLETELLSMQEGVEAMKNNYEAEIYQLRNEMSILQNELHMTKEICNNTQRLKDDLEKQLTEKEMLIGKVEDKEQKVKAAEDKLSRLIPLYNQTRDDHINLLRQNAESTKLLNREKEVNMEMKKKINDLEEKLSDLQKDELTLDHLSKEKQELFIKVENMTREYDSLYDAHKQLKQDYENLFASKDNEVANLHVEMTKLQANTEEEYERSKNRIVDLEQSLKELTDALNASNLEHSNTVNTMEDNFKLQLEEVVELKKACEIQINSKNVEIKELQEQHAETKEQLKHRDSKINELSYENNSIKSDLQNKSEVISNLSNKLAAANGEIELLLSKQIEQVKNHEGIILSLLSDILKELGRLSSTKVEDTNYHSFDKTLKHICDMEQLSEDIRAFYADFLTNKNQIKGLICQTIHLSFSFAMVHEQCLYIYSTSTDIDKGEAIFSQVNNLHTEITTLLLCIQNVNGEDNIAECIRMLNSKISHLKILVKELMDSQRPVAGLEDLVENELTEMDKAIQDAVEKFIQMLSDSRSKDDGIKLEVNGKILDACTTLMECIKVLIKKSKSLQEEIVNSGRGNATLKEFYKRNSQWTEGLISASKSVAKGANLLVEAADKAVTSESNQNFEIIVAAQEIAACTAQLVIASKVKAPKDSKKLGELTRASRDVSQATGAVVATVKDCIQKLESSQDIDLTKLTPSQVKTMEMEIHVKVLELEHALETERVKLSSFRKKHYQND